MSFTIATIDPTGQLVAAADTLVSSNSGLFADTIKPKIFEITPQYAILGSGTYYATEDFLSRHQELFNPTWNFEQAITALKMGLTIYDHDFLKVYSVHIDCSFILAYHKSTIPNIALVTRARGQTHLFQEPLLAGGYQYFFSNPKDLSFDWCNQLCQQSFQLSGRKPTKDILTEIITAVAAHSRFVNQDIQLWSPH